MSKKFWYLTRVSLKKKIGSKWFLVTNIILALAVIGIININSIIKFFGGDFSPVFLQFALKIEEILWVKCDDFCSKFWKFPKIPKTEKTVSLQNGKIPGEFPPNFGGKIRGFFLILRL